MSKPATIKPSLELEYSRALRENLAQQDALRLEERDEARARRERLKLLVQAERELRDLLDGKTNEQTRIPGTEAPTAPKPRAKKATTKYPPLERIDALVGTRQEAIDNFEKRKGSAVRG